MAPGLGLGLELTLALTDDDGDGDTDALGLDDTEALALALGDVPVTLIGRNSVNERSSSRGRSGSSKIAGALNSTSPGLGLGETDAEELALGDGLSDAEGLAEILALGDGLSEALGEGETDGDGPKRPSVIIAGRT
jgi:hypothetical protein